MQTLKSKPKYILHKIDQKIKCFGINTMDQLEIPSNQLEIRPILDISSGGTHSCALTRVFNGSSMNHMSNGNSHYYLHERQQHKPAVADKMIYCWGSDRFGQTKLPHDLRSNLRIASLKTGAYHSCLILYEFSEHGISEPAH